MSLQYGRMPCPWRIIDDLGGGFSIGCAFGSVMYFFKGVWHSPKRARIIGGISHVIRRAPILGGKLATKVRKLCIVGIDIFNGGMFIGRSKKEGRNDEFSISRFNDRCSLSF